MTNWKCSSRDFDACNYDPSATQKDDSCLYLDACGVCGGPGAIYECGCADISEVTATATETSSTPLESVAVTALEDADADGICDDVDDRGALTLVVSATAQEIYECGCADIPEGNCDCDGNQLDALGVCGGDRWKTLTPTVSVTTWMTAARLTHAAATARRSTSADVRTSPKATATATKPARRPGEVAVIALKTLTPMASATTWMTAGRA